MIHLRKCAAALVANKRERRTSTRRPDRRLNAVAHGVFCGQNILPGEDPGEYLKLLSDAVQEWEPEGATEMDAVATIAKCMWRKRMLQNFLSAKVQLYSADPEHPFFDEAKSLLWCCEYIKTASPEIIEKRPPPLRPEHEKHLREECPMEEFSSYAEWVAAVQKEIYSVLLPEVLTVPAPMLLWKSAQIIMSDEVLDRGGGAGGTPRPDARPSNQTPLASQDGQTAYALSENTAVSII
jgi:hypothetical protein